MGMREMVADDIMKEGHRYVAVAERVARVFKLSEQDACGYLMECTSFPFGTAEHVNQCVSDHVCAATVWPGVRICGLCSNPLTAGEEWDCTQCTATLDAVREQRPECSGEGID